MEKDCKWTKGRGRRNMGGLHDGSGRAAVACHLQRLSLNTIMVKKAIARAGAETRATALESHALLQHCDRIN